MASNALCTQNSLKNYASYDMRVTRRFATFIAVVMTMFFVGCSSSPKQEGAGEYIDDTVITTKVKSAIFNEASLKSAEINVETFKGEVQLSGFLSSQEALDKAVEIARNVKGVKSVKNSMTLK